MRDVSKMDVRSIMANDRRHLSTSYARPPAGDLSVGESMLRRQMSRRHGDRPTPAVDECRQFAVLRTRAAEQLSK